MTQISTKETINKVLDYYANNHLALLNIPKDQHFLDVVETIKSNTINEIFIDLNECEIPDDVYYLMLKKFVNEILKHYK